MRKSPKNGHVWLLAPMLVLATACGDVLDNVPPRPVAIEDPTVADAAFPSLAAVPARPQLTYSLEQRREIADGLVADRANARYAGDSLRQALDRPVQPDTAPSLPPAAPEPRAVEDPGGDLSLAFLEETLARDSDDGSLGDFLDRLQQPPPAVAEIRPSLSEIPADTKAANGQSDGSEASLPGAAPTAERAPEATPAVSEPPIATQVALDRSTPATAQIVVPPDAPVSTAAPRPIASSESAANPLNAAAPAAALPAAEDVAATPSDLSPAEVARMPAEPTLLDPPVDMPVAGARPADLPAMPTLPLSVVFQANAPDLGGQEHDKLRRLARDVAGGHTTIVVSGGGERAGLAMERARRVAAALVEAGLMPERIAIEMGGESNVVVVYEADA